MFTGIIEEVGRVASFDHKGDHARLTIQCARVLDGTALGDSIAVNGCCLTVEAQDDGSFAADLVAATLDATALGGLAVGDEVNLERALAAGERLGGHLVQGHVDAVGEIVDRTSSGGTVHLAVRAPDHLHHYLVAKGSVTLQGASLTIVATTADGFRVDLIPHTLEVTTFDRLQPGDRVNLEVDVIAKYVERLLAAGVSSPYTENRS